MMRRFIFTQGDKKYAVSFSEVAFPGNCGYRLMSHAKVESYRPPDMPWGEWDKALREFDKLNPSTKKALVRAAFRSTFNELIKAKKTLVRKFILSGSSEYGEFNNTLDFIKSCDLLVGKKAPGMHRVVSSPNNYYTVCAEINPYTDTKLGVKLPKGMKFVAMKEEW